MVVSLIATLTARPEMREELLRLLTDQVGPTRAEHGCMDYNLHIDASDPCIFVFYENWIDEDAFQTHLQMPHLQPLLSQPDTYRDSATSQVERSTLNLAHLKVRDRLEHMVWRPVR